MAEEQESAATLLAELIHFLDRTGLLRNSPVVEEPEVLTKARVAIVKLLAIELERDRLREALAGAREAAATLRESWLHDIDGRRFCALCDEHACTCGIEAILAALAPDTAKDEGTGSTE